MISSRETEYRRRNFAGARLARRLAVLLLLLTGGALASSPPRLIHHALGNTTIAGTPQRVVTLFQGATDTAVALGIQPVGVVDSWTEKPTYKYLRSALNGVTHVGLETQPSLEDIALLKPDLIIASRFRNEKIYGLLSQIAPTVALDEVFEFKKTVQLMGMALNRQAQANRLLSDWRQRVDELRIRLRARAGANWPPSVSVMEFRGDHVRNYLSGSFAGSILSEIGFVWPQHGSPSRQILQKLTNKESIPVLDADLFFLFIRPENPAVQQNYRDWVSHPLWRRMSAPRREQVYRVDSVVWILSGGIMGANKVLDDIERHLLGAGDAA